MTKSKLLSRRNFIQNASAASLGLASVSVLPAWAVSQNKEAKTIPSADNSTSNLVVRKNIADFPENDPEIQLLKDAVGILKKRSDKFPLDPMGWQAHGILHATFCATTIYANQVHYNWYVWPWHRLYLWSMEQKLQKAVGEPKLALHYWDWTKSNTIPSHYWGDDSNPLNNVTRLVSEEDKIPEDFINVGAAFRASSYKTFGGYPAIKKRGEDQLDGIAEQSFHNNIHNWIGGQMATFTESGFDPIFYGHHGNCDRIWAAWQAYSPNNTLPEDEEWLEKELYATDGNGKPIGFKIKELLNEQDLGYQFADLDLNQNFCNPFMHEMLPERAEGGADCFAELNLSASASGAIFTDFENKEKGHVILHFERAQLPYQPYCARIFFEYDSKSVYTGTFTILPILDLDTVLLQNGVHLQIEVDKDLINAVNAKKKITVVFQPVPLPNRDIPQEPLKLENITLKAADV